MKINIWRGTELNWCSWCQELDDDDVVFTNPHRAILWLGGFILFSHLVSSLIQIEAKHIKHSNEEQYDYGAGSSLSSLCAWKNLQKVHVEEVALISIAISSKSEWFFSMVWRKEIMRYCYTIQERTNPIIPVSIADCCTIFLILGHCSLVPVLHGITTASGFD